jgi:hypothetical protein
MRFSVLIPTMRPEAVLAATPNRLRRYDPAPHEVIDLVVGARTEWLRRS